MLKMYTSVLFICLPAFTLGAHLPPTFQTCSLSDANVDECLRAAVEDSVNQLADGNKELKIPAVDPFVIESLTIDAIPGPISVRQTYTDVKFTGFSKSRIIAFRVALQDGCQMYLESMTPHLEATMQYYFKGQFTVIPVNAKGELHSYQENFKTTNNITCEVFEDGGEKYVRIVDIQAAFYTDKLKINLGKLIEGSQELNNQLSKIMDEEPFAFYEVLKPAAERMWETIIRDVFNKIFTGVPLGEVFKD